MIKTVLKLGLILVAGILIYNYFLGTPEEKATSKQIFSEVKDLGSATWALLKSEKEKFDEGKYDEALDKVGDMFQGLKEKAAKLKDSDLSDRISDLDRQRENLKNKVDDAEKAGKTLSDEEKKELKQSFKELMDETEQLMKDMEKK